MSVKFSIVLPTFNRANFLVRSIESVLNQEYKDWELVVVDDGSTDNTRELLKEYCENDVRIKYIYQENKERSAARNNGLKHSTGNWVCFLDSDDEYYPNHLSCLEKAINKFPKERFFITGINLNSNGTKSKRPFLDFISHNKFKVVAEDFILMNTVCINSNLFKENKFDERFSLWEDTQLWLRLLTVSDAFQINEYTCQQNIHMNSSVVQGLNLVKIGQVKGYMRAIESLRKYSEIDLCIGLDSYKRKKLNMYLYQARQNRQLLISLMIWKMLFKIEPSKKVLFDLPKIIINKLGFGIHD